MNLDYVCDNPWLVLPVSAKEGTHVDKVCVVSLSVCVYVCLGLYICVSVCVYVCVCVCVCVCMCSYVLTLTTIVVDNTSIFGQALEFLLSYAEK
jgi:hypothetical protein